MGRRELAGVDPVVTAALAVLAGNLERDTFSFSKYRNMLKRTAVRWHWIQHF
jgi:hypothetical protein